VFHDGPQNKYLQIHVPLGEVAGGKVEVGAVDGHQLGEEHSGGLGLDVIEVVAVHEDAALGRVAVDVDVQKQAGKFGIPWTNVLKLFICEIYKVSLAGAYPSGALERSYSLR